MNRLSNIAICLCFFLWYPHGSPAADDVLQLTETEQAWLAEHPVIRIGIDAGYAPYSFLDTDGKFIGVAPDFINLISKKLGIKFEAVPDLSWPQILQGAREHSLDVIATAVITEERKSFLNFTQIYISTPLVIMSRVDDDRIKTASDLAGLTVALVEGYSSSKRVMDEHQSAKILQVANPKEGLHAVSSGEADAYVGVVGINIYQAQKQGITNLKITSNYDVVSNGQRFAIRSDWRELPPLFDRAINSITEEQRKAIYDKWISVSYVEQVDYSLLWKALIIFLLIVSLLYMHNRRLYREVRRRKVVEQKLLDLNKSLVEARYEADTANKAKSQFLSSMSHELRTPLNAILGFSQLLEMNENDDETKQNIDEIITAGNHLLKLITEILDLSKIESGKIEISIASHNLNELLYYCLAIIKPAADKRSISIENNVIAFLDITVKVDEMRFKQVALNLLSNAVKYNNENGKVIIDCSKVEGDMLQLSITDDGNGLTMEQQHQLFKPFNRVGAEASNIEGTGLGLAISKDLIELMGGSIGVESEVGKGSCFWLKIPLSEIK